jgi:hypothetical protein
VAQAGTETSGKLAFPPVVYMLYLCYILHVLARDALYHSGGWGYL